MRQQIADLFFSVFFSSYIFYLLVPTPVYLLAFATLPRLITVACCSALFLIGFSSKRSRQSLVLFGSGLMILGAMLQTTSNILFSIEVFWFFFVLGFSPIVKNIKWFGITLIIFFSTHFCFFAVDLFRFFGTQDFSVSAVFLATRFGRQHLSIVFALIFLLSSLFVSKPFQSRSYVLLFGLLLLGSLVGLFLLDSRATIIALFGPVLIILRNFFKPNKNYILIKQTLVVLLCLMFCFFICAHDRYSRLVPSLKAVYSTQSDIAWLTPEYFKNTFCDLKECQIDESTFLRLSWLRFGLRSFWTHPLGIGENEQALRYLLLKKYPHLVSGQLPYDNFHNQFLSLGVQFGVPVLWVLYLMIFSFRKGYGLLCLHNSESMYPIVYVVALFFFCRSLVDAISEGPWILFLALMGLLSSFVYPGIEILLVEVERRLGRGTKGGFFK